MHEGHFTERIVEAIVKEISKQPGRAVESVTVKVGEAYHVEPDSVLLHFDLISKETQLEGVKLNLVEVPMQIFCKECGKQGPVEDHHLLLCSFCQSRRVKAVSGDTVTIEKIVFKENSV